MEEIIPILIDILEQYGYIIVFLGTLIGGELVVLAAVFLASIGMLNIFWVVVLGMAGIILSDNFWYFVGTKMRKRINKLRKRFVPSKWQKKIDNFKDKFTDHYAKFLVVSKFVYGARILTLVTSGYQKIPYKSFALFNILGSTLWMVVIVFLGYVMGISWNYLAQYNESAKYYVLFGLLALFVIRYVSKRFINLNSFNGRR